MAEQPGKAGSHPSGHLPVPDDLSDRLQARFVDRTERGDFFPVRSSSVVLSDDGDATVQAQLDRLREQLEAAFAGIDARIEEASDHAELAAARAARVVAAAEALAAELDRLSSSLPARVADELDGAIERFSERLRTA